MSDTQRRPNILGLYSHGGAGHLSALESVVAALGDAYQVNQVAPLRQICAAVDPIRRLTRGRWDGEDLYNALAARGRNRQVSLLAAAGARLFPLRRPGLVRLLSAYVATTRPDLILSTMPFINGALWAVAQAHRIPLLVVTCDLNLAYYVSGIERPAGDLFALTYAFAEATIAASLASAKLLPTQLLHVGFPLRPVFTEPISAAQMQALRLEAGLPRDRSIVVIMMGGAGSRIAEDYVRVLRRGGHRLHLVILTGRNAALKTRLDALPPTPQVTLTTVAFTAAVQRLLGCADVLITKPGATSVMEAMSLGIPMLLDCTQGVIAWERDNVAFATRRGAAAVRHISDVPQLLLAQLQQPRSFAATAPFVDFPTRLRQTVRRLLTPATAGLPAPALATATAP